MLHATTFKPFSSGDLTVRITALHVLHFIPRAKDLLTIIHCSIYNISSFVLGRSAA